MTPLSLTPEQHRAIQISIIAIRDAMRDLKDVAEHHRVFGLGDLHRRLSADESRTSQALTAVAQILESAAQQAEGRV